MKTLTNALIITSITLAIGSFISIVGYNQEFHNDPVLQIGSIANAFVGIGAICTRLTNDF
jgi:hypothetical protein